MTILIQDEQDELCTDDNLQLGYKPGNWEGHFMDSNLLSKQRKKKRKHTKYKVHTKV